MKDGCGGAQPPRVDPKLSKLTSSRSWPRRLLIEWSQVRVLLGEPYQANLSSKIIIMLGDSILGPTFGPTRRQRDASGTRDLGDDAPRLRGLGYVGYRSTRKPASIAA